MNRIAELRKEKGIKQVELAKIFQVSQGTLSNWERGVHDIDQATLNKIASYFEVTLDYLLGRTTGSTPQDQIGHMLEDDEELHKMWEVLKDRDDMVLLFKQVKDLDASDIKRVMRVIKAIEDEEAEGHTYD